MSERNDKAFAEFMVRLAKKMMEREDQQEAEREVFKAAMAAKAAQTTQVLNALIATSQNIAVKSKAAALKSAPPLPTPTKGSIKRGFDGRPGQFVSDDEMAVIRAYFNGEDVLTTILSQER